MAALGNALAGDVLREPFAHGPMEQRVAPLMRMEEFTRPGDRPVTADRDAAAPRRARADFEDRIGRRTGGGEQDAALPAAGGAAAQSPGAAT